MKKVLIADDSATIRDILRFAFESAEYEVYTAENGIEAVLAAYECDPDLIFLDLEMPKMNGYQACRLLKEDPTTRNIPIVIQTSLDKEKDRFWGYATGADLYLVKGLDPEELIDEVENFLEKYRPPAEKLSAGRTGRKITADYQILENVNDLLDRKLFQSTIVNKLGELSIKMKLFDEVIVGALSLLRSSLDFDLSMLLLLNDREPLLYIDRVICINSDYQQTAIEKLRQKLLELSVDIDPAGLEPNILESSAQFEDGACLDSNGFSAIPMIIRDEIVGLIAVSGSVDLNSPKQDEMLKVFADAASIVIDSAVLYRNLQFSYEELKTKEEEIKWQNEALENYNKLLKDVFGRYQTIEVVETLLGSEEALEIGGERRMITVMFTDLRGFTAMTEEYGPDIIVGMLNRYYDRIIGICQNHGGVVIEIMGDGLVVYFGAPLKMENHAVRAVVCAIEMQAAMAEINQGFINDSLPEISMGIGINTGEVVVGNIGSDKRAKYCAVGGEVNLAARIESMCVGGQVLASQSTVDAIDDASGILRIDSIINVAPKGVRGEIKIFNIGGVGGEYNIELDNEPEQMRAPSTEVCFDCYPVKDKQVSRNGGKARLLNIGRERAVLKFDSPVEQLADLKLKIAEPEEAPDDDIYIKVTETPEDSELGCSVFFSHMPPAVRKYFDQL